MLRVGIRVLPLVEMLIGMWLIFGLWATTALGVTTFILAAFTVALLVLVRREYIGSCACFGMADQHSVGWVHVGRNLVFVTASATAVAYSVTSFCVHAPVWQLPPFVLALAVALLVFAIIMHLLAVEIEKLLRYSDR